MCRWDVALRKNKVVGIHKLRVQYCHKIIASSTNVIALEVKNMVVVYETTKLKSSRK